MATLRFTVGTQQELRYTKTVDDSAAEEHLVNFMLGRSPYASPWVLIDEGVFLHRESIVAVCLEGGELTRMAGGRRAA